ncbi:NB-ARC domain-containing protein [Amycolatopsis sp. GA6-003]|uniref:NB-ARC domain-containing protein n=1 Tax=Amycolatopsis sp. GA6-003 TaxID=2652444 RepID=UPI003916DD6C
MCVLTGLGGVGKTQLAAEFSKRAWASGEVDLLVRVAASSGDAIVSAYARLVADVTGMEDSAPEQGVARLLQWLAANDRRWPVVLDDVQRPSDLQGLWPPAVAAGQLLVTTRRKDDALRGRGRHRVEVGVSGEAEPTPTWRRSSTTSRRLDQNATTCPGTRGFCCSR